MSETPDAPAPDRPATVVGVGLIRRGGRFLVRRRQAGRPLAGLWEFPGGKCEPGETPEQAARRECREELGLEVVIGSRRLATTHDYPHGRVDLYYFDGGLAEPSADPGPETGFVWVSAEALADLDFPEANGPVIVALIREFGRPASD